MSKQQTDERDEERIARDIALDTMCSTLKSAYRDWNRKKEGERKTA